MSLIKFLAAISFFLFAALNASLLPQRQPTGLNNRKNTCYMNALLSSLYDVTPFRKAVYDHHEDSILARAFAGVFARKQLNLVSALDLERDFIPTIERISPLWQFGRFQDIDEFLKAIIPFVPDSIANSIGFVERRQLSTDNGAYVINEGQIISNSMLGLNLPETPIKGLKLQDLIAQYMMQSEPIPYRIERDDHPAYFQAHDISWDVYQRNIEAVTKPVILEYADVVPIFIGRRTLATGRADSTDFRNDEIDVPESLDLPLHTGETVSFTLVSFAVYHPGHYLAYGKSFPSTEWFSYNDETVEKPSTSRIIKELERNAVMLFYVRKGRHVACVIPAPVENWSIASLIVQHIRSNLVGRVEKMVKKAKKADKKRR